MILFLEIHIKTILFLKVRMKAILFLKVRWRQFLSESPLKASYFWKSDAGNLFLKVRMKANYFWKSAWRQYLSLFAVKFKDEDMRTQCFQDMPEEGELDGDYEPLDECLNPLCYSLVCCLLFTNIFCRLRQSPLLSVFGKEHHD